VRAWGGAAAKTPRGEGVEVRLGRHDNTGYAVVPAPSTSCRAGFRVFIGFERRRAVTIPSGSNLTYEKAVFKSVWTSRFGVARDFEVRNIYAHAHALLTVRLKFRKNKKNYDGNRIFRIKNGNESIGRIKCIFASERALIIDLTNA